jgi:hypothetical protein
MPVPIIIGLAALAGAIAFAPAGSLFDRFKQAVVYSGLKEPSSPPPPPPPPPGGTPDDVMALARRQFEAWKPTAIPAYAGMPKESDELILIYGALAVSLLVLLGRD